MRASMFRASWFRPLARGRDIAQRRHGHRPVRPHHDGAAELRVLPHGERQDILRSDEIVLRRPRGPVVPAAQRTPGSPGGRTVSIRSRIALIPSRAEAIPLPPLASLAPPRSPAADPLPAAELPRSSSSVSRSRRAPAIAGIEPVVQLGPGPVQAPFPASTPPGPVRPGRRAKTHAEVQSWRKLASVVSRADGPTRLISPRRTLQSRSTRSRR